MEGLGPGLILLVGGIVSVSTGSVLIKDTWFPAIRRDNKRFHLRFRVYPDEL
jgi:hypothetical protein